MYLYKPIEYEIKTGWTQEQLHDLLGKKATFSDDVFRIIGVSSPFDIMCNAKGKIYTSDEYTMVNFKVYASEFLNVFSAIWLGGTALAFIYFSIQALMNWTYNGNIHISLIMWTIGFVFLQLYFSSMADSKYESVKRLLNNKQR